ncbi:MAG: hypothetical protein EZS28_013396 [Streblomastix strix]|uniref:Uncharacterized protein n=1 Tax=Streblomastix strix TaxID=222440 RepID=A0A5J4W859_9EUKA|nr:MAG: hypothetical protein EZS28_013396 [Streblomastix strix]
MQSSSTDKQRPDKQLMTHNDAAEQILKLARIHSELQDPEQTKAQLLHARFGEDDLDLRKPAGCLGIVGFKAGEKDTRAPSRRYDYGRQDQIRTQLIIVGLNRPYGRR